MLLLAILVPILLAGLISVALARREAATDTGTGVKHAPRAAGFGRGGQPLPIESTGEAGLKAMLEPDYHRPWWVRTLRLVVLALLLTIAAAFVATALYELGKAAGDAFKHFVTSG